MSVGAERGAGAGSVEEQGSGFGRGEVGAVLGGGGEEGEGGGSEQLHLPSQT